MTTTKHPGDQYQIGDRVLYTPEGVITTVDGYVWSEGLAQTPKIIAYKLACGIAVPINLIIEWDELD